jgi:hypothetical protein
MDPVSTELAKEGISGAVEAAKEFLFKIAGPAAEEIGLLFQDQIKLYRFKNQLRILTKAEAMLKKSGRTPNAVPFRTLLPILEAAGSEDEEPWGTLGTPLTNWTKRRVGKSMGHFQFISLYRQEGNPREQPLKNKGGIYGTFKMGSAFDP